MRIIKIINTPIDHISQNKNHSFLLKSIFRTETYQRDVYYHAGCLQRQIVIGSYEILTLPTFKEKNHFHVRS